MNGKIGFKVTTRLSGELKISGFANWGSFIGGFLPLTGPVPFSLTCEHY